MTATDADGLKGTATVTITINESKETPRQALVNGSWTAEWTNKATGNDSSDALSFNSDGTVTLGGMWTSSKGTWTLVGVQVTMVFSSNYSTSTWIGSINTELNKIEGTYSDTLGNGGPWEANRNIW